MRIAHVSDCFLPRMGGIERQVDGLSRRQAGRGDDVEIITSVGDRFGVDERPRSGRPTVRRPRASAERPTAIHYAGSLRTARTVDLASYDVVHVHGSTFSPLAFLVAQRARKAGTPVVFTLHSMWTGGVVPAARALGTVTGWTRWPVTWTAVSHAAATNLQRLVREEVLVLPNGVDQSFWRRPHVSGRTADLRLVSVMRLASRKRPMQLLAMLRSLREQVPAEVGLSVRIIGDGPLRGAMTDRIRRWGMQSWVQLDGQLTPADIRSAFAQSDAYVAPARLEAFGIAALEAHTAGLPVVAFAASGVADIVEDGRTGLLVADDHGMVQALRRLALDRPLLTQLTTSATEASSPFRWDVVLQRSDAAYRQARARSAIMRKDMCQAESTQAAEAGTP